MIKWLNDNKRKVVLAAYALVAMLWLASRLWFFIGDAMRPESALGVPEAALENLVVDDTGVLLSEGVDPQLVFTHLDAKVRLVRLDATFKNPPGEMELFYTRKDGQGFSLKKRVIGVPQADGGYLYTLPPGKINALRLDPAGAGANAIDVAAIRLNPGMPAAYYWIPSLRVLLALALLPALALSVLYSIPYKEKKAGTTTAPGENEG